MLKTGFWYGNLPQDHIRIGISRGVPRRMAAGNRVFRKLAPGPWFNSVGVAGGIATRLSRRSIRAASSSRYRPSYCDNR